MVKSLFQVVLATVVDTSEAFVKATNNLEGDGLLVLTAVEVKKVSKNVYPFTRSVSKRVNGK